jgi:hypothetical protein
MSTSLQTTLTAEERLAEEKFSLASTLTTRKYFVIVVVVVVVVIIIIIIKFVETFWLLFTVTDL